MENETMIKMLQSIIDEIENRLMDVEDGEMPDYTEDAYHNIIKLDDVQEFIRWRLK